MQFLCIGFYEGRFLKLGVYVEVAESKPIVERYRSEYEHYCEGPKVELYMVLGCKREAVLKIRLTVRVIEYERTEYIKRGIEMVIKATRDLNHFNNQTNEAEPALSDHSRTPGQCGKSTHE